MWQNLNISQTPITDEDIDVIIGRGEYRTQENTKRLQEKCQHTLQTFSLKSESTIKDNYHAFLKSLTASDIDDIENGAVEDQQQAVQRLVELITPETTTRHRAARSIGPLYETFFSDSDLDAGEDVDDSTSDDDFVIPAYNLSHAAPDGTKKSRPRNQKKRTNTSKHMQTAVESLEDGDDAEDTIDLAHESDGEDERQEEEVPLLTEEDINKGMSLETVHHYVNFFSKHWRL